MTLLFLQYVTCENEVTDSAIIRSSTRVLNSFKIKNYSRSSWYSYCYLFFSSLNFDTMLLFLYRLSSLREEYEYSTDAQAFTAHLIE